MMNINRPYRYVPSEGGNKEKPESEQAWFMLMPFPAPELISFETLQREARDGGEGAASRIIEVARNHTIDCGGFVRSIYNPETKEVEEKEVESVDEFFEHVNFTMMSIVINGLCQPVSEEDLGN